MASWNEVIDGIASWEIPSGIQATATLSLGPKRILIRLEIPEHESVAAEVVIDRPSTVHRTWELMNRAVRDLRKAIRWHASNTTEVSNQ